MWKLALAVPCILYLAAAIFIYLGQTAMLFPARLALPAGSPPPSASVLQLSTPSGHHLQGLHIAPSQRADRRLLILGFGGNAWNAASTAEYLHELFPEADVIAFHYRGYPPSGGAPSAKALLEDAVLVHDFARQRLGDTRTLAVGFSIGSGIAAHLARRRPLDGAILVTPFDSLAEVAAGHYPWLPVRWLFRHRMEPARDLRESRVPIALIGAERDSLIVPSRTDALRRSIGQLAFDRTIAAAEHHDIYDRVEFRSAVRDAAAALLSR